MPRHIAANISFHTTLASKLLDSVEQKCAQVRRQCVFYETAKTKKLSLPVLKLVTQRGLNEVATTLVTVEATKPWLLDGTIDRLQGLKVQHRELSHQFDRAFCA